MPKPKKTAYPPFKAGTAPFLTAPTKKMGPKKRQPLKTKSGWGADTVLKTKW